MRVASAIDVAWLEELFPQSIRRERAAVFDAHAAAGRRAAARLLPRPAAARGHGRRGRRRRRPATVLARGAAPPRGRDRSRPTRPPPPRSPASRCSAARCREHPWPGVRRRGLGDVLSPRPARGSAASTTCAKRPLAGRRCCSRGSHYPLDRLLEQHAPETIEVPDRQPHPPRLLDSRSSPPRRCSRCGCRSCSAGPTRRASPAGACRCVLHLLGPNYRPVQVTDDLRSFWSTTYFQVRKDLRCALPEALLARGPAEPPSREAKGGRQTVTFRHESVAPREAWKRIDHLRRGGRADPQPAAGEVVLASPTPRLNPADRYLAEGQYPAQAAVAAHPRARRRRRRSSRSGDACGTSTPATSCAILRSEVGVSRPGTFAEHVAVPVESLVDDPARLERRGGRRRAAGLPHRVPGADAVGRPPAAGGRARHRRVRRRRRRERPARRRRWVTPSSPCRATRRSAQRLQAARRAARARPDGHRLARNASRS